MDLVALLERMIAIPTVTGFEARHADDFASLVMAESGGFWDGFEKLKTGSLLFRRETGIPDAKKLVLDAHFDTVGFVVSEHENGGFVKVAPLAGIDPTILPSSPVMLYGTRAVRGFFTSVPPHLAKKDGDKTVKTEDLYVDTGLADEELRDALPIGTPLSFCAQPTRLAHDVIASHSLDNKACAAAIVLAARLLAESAYGGATDVYAHFSAGEERSQTGASGLPYLLCADACIVLDVNFAVAPGVNRYEALVMGDGPGVSYSTSIKRTLTDFIVKTAKAHKLACQSVVEMRSTGTNATGIHKGGIPSAVLSVPLRNMHTYCETVCLSDIEGMAALLAAIVRDFAAYPSAEEVLK